MRLAISLLLLFAATPASAERFSMPILIGDSWTDQQTSLEVWPDHMPPSFKYINKARSGSFVTTNPYNHSMGADINEHLAANQDVDSMIVMGGTNDINAYYTAGYIIRALTEIINVAKQYSNIKDILVLSPGVNESIGPANGGGPQHELDKLLVELPALCEREGCEYIDVNAIVNDAPNGNYQRFRTLPVPYRFDDKHMNAEGNQALADVVSAKIAEIKSRDSILKPIQTSDQGVGWNPNVVELHGNAIHTSHLLSVDRSVYGYQVIPIDKIFGPGGISSGKWYVELEVVSLPSGVANSGRFGWTETGLQGASWTEPLGEAAFELPAIRYGNMATRRSNRLRVHGETSGNFFYPGELEVGSTLMAAIDVDNEEVWVGISGHWQPRTTGVGVYANPATGVGGTSIDSVDGNKDWTLAIQTTTGTDDIEIMVRPVVYTSHIPAGYSILSDTVPIEAVVEIDVQISDPGNHVKPASNELISVAIHSTSIADGDFVDFDATQVDPSTLRFGIGGAPNIAVPWVMDWDGDNIVDDVAFAFRTQDSGFFCNDTEVWLEGETYSGEPLIGTDTIQIKDCNDLGGCHPQTEPE
jgi:lysophospholipase L1-like esterase